MHRGREAANVSPRRASRHSCRSVDRTTSAQNAAPRIASAPGSSALPVALPARGRSRPRSMIRRSVPIRSSRRRRIRWSSRSRSDIVAWEAHPEPEPDPDPDPEPEPQPEPEPVEDGGATREFTPADEAEALGRRAPRQPEPEPEPEVDHATRAFSSDEIAAARGHTPPDVDPDDLDIAWQDAAKRGEALPDRPLRQIQPEPAAPPPAPAGSLPDTEPVTTARSAPRRTRRSRRRGGTVMTPPGDVPRGPAHARQARSRPDRGARGDPRRDRGPAVARQRVRRSRSATRAPGASPSRSRREPARARSATSSRTPASSTRASSSRSAPACPARAATCAPGATSCVTT